MSCPNQCLFLGLVTALLVGFAVAPARAQSIAQWDFDGSLEASTDHEDLFEEMVPPGFDLQVDFEELEIGDDVAEVARFAQGTVFRLTHGFEPNGGGGYVNQYTLILDVMYPEAFGELDPDGLLGTDGWQCLYQTNEGNANDADWCVQPDGSGGGIGISGNYGGTVADDEWHRLALAVDLVAGTYTSYIDGVEVQKNTGLGVDGRFSLGPTIIVFADDNGETAGGYVNSLQIRDWTMSPGDIGALGGPSFEGITLPECTSPRCCLNRQFTGEYDRERNRVALTWNELPGSDGFRVRRGGVVISDDLPGDVTSFEDADSPAGGVDVLYSLETLVGGEVEGVCEASVARTFACPSTLECCVDQQTLTVELRWASAANVALGSYVVTREGVEVGRPAGDADSFQDVAPGSGRYTYMVTPDEGSDCTDAMSCVAVVTGVVTRGGDGCSGVVNQYDFNGDLTSSTGGLDLVPDVTAPLVPGVDAPDLRFEDAEIDGEEAEVAYYGRGTAFRLLTGLPGNGGGVYTNRYTLILDVMFPAGALDDSGWAVFFNTNCTSSNDGDWFLRGSDRGVGISGNYSGRMEDDQWHRIALVVDLVAGTYTSYIDGLQVQQNTGLGLDGRFSLYSTDPSGGCNGEDIVWLFGDDSGDNSPGLVNSAQIRDQALSAGEVAAMGRVSAEGIPFDPPFVCPMSLACCVDQSSASVTLSWVAGADLPDLSVYRDDQLIGTVSGDSDSFVDDGVPSGPHTYELRLADGDGCANLPLSCDVTALGPDDAFFFDDFDCYREDADLEAAGWTRTDEADPVEAATWTISNPLHRANPPGPSGAPSSGGFLISDSDFGGTADVQNLPGSGMSHDVISPGFSTEGADSVWLHFDAVAHLNNDGDAVFDVDVSADGGETWTNVLRRVSPGRAFDPLPTLDGDNADGLFGRVHIDISAEVANTADARLRLRHFEPTWDWFVAVDNVLVDSRPAAGGSAEHLALEEFADEAIPGSWEVRTGPQSDQLRSWNVDDICLVSLFNGAGGFPDAAGGLQLHHFDEYFALVDPVCTGDAMDEFLITPSVDCSQLDGVTLQVASAILHDTAYTAEILLSLDGGETFEAEPVFSYDGGGAIVSFEEPLFNEFAFDVSRAAGQGEVAFAFHYSTNGAQLAMTWWAIDNVRISAEGTTAPGRRFRRGDADDSSDLQLTDAVNILNFLFIGGPAPSCMEAADADNNGRLELTDGVVILNFLFTGGPPPAEPGHLECGVDSDPAGSPGDSGCEEYGSC